MIDLEDDEDLEEGERPKPKKPQPDEKAPESIGTPIAPEMGTSVTRPDIMPQDALTIGQPISEMKPQRPAAARYNELAAQGAPEYHGWHRALDTLAGATNIGTAIERAGGFGTQGYNAKLARAGGAAEGEAKRISEENTAADVAAQTKQRGAIADLDEARARAANNPSMKTGITPDELTLHDLMTGNNGGPKINPDNGQPYTYLDAYGAVKQKAQDVKPDRAPKHQPGEVRLNEGIPDAVYGENDKLYRSGDPNMPPDLKLSLDDAMKAHSTHVQEQLKNSREGRAVYAGSRAINVITADGVTHGVDGLDLPEFLRSNPGSVVATGQATTAMGQEALLNDVRVSAHNVEKNLAVLDRQGFDYAKLAASLADPSSTMQSYLQAIPRGSLDEQGQQFVSDLYNLREQAMAMRAILKAGQGSEDLRHAILNTLPGISSGSSGFGEKQVQNLLAVLERVERGVPGVPQRPAAGGGGGEGLTPPGPEKPGMKWQHRTTNGKTEWRQTPQ